MSQMLESLLDPERRHECEEHDADELPRSLAESDAVKLNRRIDALGMENAELVDRVDKLNEAAVRLCRTVGLLVGGLVPSDSKAEVLADWNARADSFLPKESQ